MFGEVREKKVALINYFVVSTTGTQVKHLLMGIYYTTSKTFVVHVGNEIRFASKKNQAMEKNFNLRHFFCKISS